MFFFDCLYFVISKVIVKFDNTKLKKLIDLIFILAEKIVVKLNKLLPFYLDFYEDMVENEIILADISKNDKILHIGCGPIPATSILVAKKTKAHVTGIDNKIISVKQASNIISSQNLSDKIKIIHADALDFSLENFDLIIISQGVKPYDKILKRISSDMNKDGRVVLRTTSTQNGKLTEKDVFLNDLFNVDKIIRQEKNGLLISVLLLPFSSI